MNENIGLLNLDKQVRSDYVFIAKSELLSGYSYCASPDNFRKLNAAFGSEEESREAFEEDSKEWLVVLFEYDDFEQFEEDLVMHYGSEQAVLSSLVVKEDSLPDSEKMAKENLTDGLEKSDMPEKTEESQEESPVSESEQLEKEGCIEKKVDEGKEREVKEPSGKDIIQYLLHIRNEKTKRILLSILTMNLDDGYTSLLDSVYEASFDAVMRAWTEDKETTEAFLKLLLDQFQTIVRGDEE